MLDLPLLLAFVAAAAILTITPGVDTAMVLRASTTGSRREGVLAAAGISLGCLIWGAAVSLGLGAILRASVLAYTIVKLAGAAYLLWLGFGLIFKPRTGLATPETTPERNSQHAFLRGLLTNLLNPKIGVFYVTFLPQFVPAGADIAAYTFFLACLHVLISLVWFAVLIAASVPLGRMLREPKAVKRLDRLTGGVFMAFGLKLALSPAR
ncbi:LysE family translocator [Novosphingobium terrae]|uniref:LysE family translocator n=1 Tax=Novosphingobium terrae TaxID=2726189 RepID=UPI00198077E7|nr:LysE family translocator [Novosphingobium terrae]